MSRKALLDIGGLIKQSIEINCSRWRWRCKYTFYHCTTS